MRYFSVLCFPKALIALSATLCLSGVFSQAQVNVPASAAVARAAGGIGAGLKGEYWLRPSNSILVDGATVPANRIDTQIAGFGAPSGTFSAKSFVYLGNDLTPVGAWLGSDSASYSGVAGNLDDGAFRFKGYLNITAPGTLNIGANSDDGTRITIAGLDVIANDGSHGDVTVNADANFAAAGLYPIEITYFNGDWTDNAVCSGNHDPSPTCTAHGGGNFRLLIGGANITAAQVGTYLFDELPDELPHFRNIGQNKIGSATNMGNGSFTVVGGGNDIWSGRDEFTYKYTEVMGDFDVQVRVESLTANAQWSKAGIMVRESLSEFSRMAFARVTPNLPPGQNDRNFAYRTGLDNVAGANGGEHEDGSGPSGIPNGWLRLTRIGNTVSMSNSADGIAWSLNASQDTTTWGGGALSNKLFLGLGVSRHSGGPTATAVFRQFQFNSNAAPFAVVGAETRGNPNGVRIYFNNPVGAGAFTAANYTLTTASGPNVTVVTGLRFTTANDAVARDPMTFTLEGTTADPSVGDWKLIASGDTGLATDPGRNTVGPIVPVANTNGYRAYRLLFPTVRDAVAANSMQIAEIELLGAGDVDVTAPGDTIIGVRAIAGNSMSEVAVAGTTGGANNYPAAEHPGLAIDNVVSPSKYLNFAKTNTGVIVTPSGGAQPADPIVSAATAGPNANTVQLTTSQLTDGAVYELVAENVLAENGSGLSSGLTIFTHGAGYEARRIHVTHNKNNDGGYYRLSDAVTNGIGDVVRMTPSAPVGVYPPVESNTVFEDPIPDRGGDVDGNERFSSRIAGVLAPRVTGAHTFYMSSDDVGYLYLSTDANPANKVQIATEPFWNGRREYIVGSNSNDPDHQRGNPQSNISTPQNLQAGGKYYLELIFTEGGGGNNGSATWLPPGGPAVTNGSPPINETNFVPSRMFDGNSFFTLGPVRIAAPPTNLTVLALLPATFSVGLDGTPRYTYQWRRNGVPIPGATGRTYTLPTAQISDDQSVYSVAVANEFSSAVSGNAVLTVLTPTPPHLLSAEGSFSTVTVKFDNRLEVASAQNIANYTITNAAGVVAIASATRLANARDVALKTVAPMPEGTLHTVIVRDLHDETGTTTLQSNPTNATFTTLVSLSGYVLKEYYQQWVGGAASVDAFIAAQRAGTTPVTQRCLTPLFEQNTADEYENYGGRIVGYFVPTVSGNHVFYFASDDYGRLFLSTDSSAANIREIAREPVWSARRTWVGEAGGGGRLATPSASGGPQANISGPINLVAGERYYMEAFFTEGGGGDNMGVAVQPPGAAAPANNDSPITGVNLVYAQAADTLAITAQPQDQTVVLNALATFTVGATSNWATVCGSNLFQWRVNGVDIPGANQASLTVGPVSQVNSGELYSVVLTTPTRSVTSSNALLRVVDDTFPPVLLSVRQADGSFSRLSLSWSELMAQGPAEEEGNYHLFASGGAEILNAVTTATLVNGTNVILDLATPLAVNGVYSLEVDFQTDLVPNPTVKVGNPVFDTLNGVVASVRAFVISRGFVKKELYLNTGVGSVAISSLRSAPNYPNSPDIVRYGQLLELNTFDEFENYGARLSGWILPPVSGNYTVYMAADDNGEFWLSTDATPANIVNIANEPVWSGRRTWVGEAGGGGRLGVPSPSGGPQANISGPIPLVAGQMYYFETLVKEAGGGDNLGAVIQLPGGPAVATGDLPFPGALLGALADPVGASITISQQPSSTNVLAGQTASLSVRASGVNVGGVAPLNYQWQLGSGGVFTDILGAYGSNFTTTAVGAGENRQYRALVFIPGATATSAVASVTEGAGGPRIRFSRSGGGLTLSWDAPLRLQCTANLNTPIVWQDVDTGGATTYTVNPSNQFDVNLDAAQAGGAGRTGIGSGTVTVSGNIATVDVTYSGLSSDRTIDHFHAPAARGANAGVVYDLGAITTGTRSGTIKGNVTLVDGTYAGKNVAAQVQDIRDSLWYLNIHTTTFGGGEIRGQVEPAKARFYRLVP